jgi:hypothetical protein
VIYYPPLLLAGLSACPSSASSKIIPRISREASGWPVLHPGSSSPSSRTSCWRLLLASLSGYPLGLATEVQPAQDEVEGARHYGLGVLIAEDAAAGQGVFV